jgi:beta-lactamase superfamily II metal-dependent hydrolase
LPPFIGRQQAIALLVALMLLAPTEATGAVSVSTSDGARSVSSAPQPCTPAYEPGTLEVHFIDVGQGNATLVVAPSGKTLLVDTGERVQATKVATYLRTILCRLEVDYVVVSHYHADHFGSYRDLRRQGLSVTTATYDRGGDQGEYPSNIYADYYDYCARTDVEACKRRTIGQDDLIDLGPEITVRIACAGSIETRTACGESIISENDNTIIVVVTYATLDVWMGGDASGDPSRRSYADVESAAVGLAKIGAELDVYGVNHHGSCHSTNSSFVEATRPTAAVFSLGRNPYGHPCPEVVDRLSTAGTTLYFTEDGAGQVVDGDVKVVSRGGSTYTVTGVAGTTTYATK